MPSEPFPNVDELVKANGRFASGFADGDLQVAPLRRLAIVACMDSRMDIFALLGLGNGEAHVIRNAGGVVTDDVIRSLCLSQRALGTEEIMLVHHTDCGLQKIDATDFKAVLEAETGVKPSWSVEAFMDPYRDVVQSARRLQMTPFLPNKLHISGFVYNVETGLLERVAIPDL